MNKDELVSSLERLYEQLVIQHAVLIDQAGREGIPISELRLRDGSYPVNGILCAKAEVLAALVRLT